MQTVAPARWLAVVATVLTSAAAFNEYNDGRSRDFEALYKKDVGWYPEWQPDTDAYRSMMDYRAAQVARIKDSQQRYDGYLVLLQQGLEVPHFTEKGWAVVKCPEEVHAKLNASLHAKMDVARFEGKVDQIHCDEGTTVCDGEARPLFVHTGLNQEVMRALQPIHEEWSGVELIPSTAYGLRVYQNGSSLTMHTDRIETHVISSILHVDRDYGGREPWPIVIEGVDGVTREVDLKPGEMLLYESAKCTHGRPRSFRGNWYTSLFIHYRPVGWKIDRQKMLANVPDRWNKPLPPHKDVEELTVYGTGFKERGCPHGWCTLRDEWPGEEATRRVPGLKWTGQSILPEALEVESDSSGIRSEL